LVSNCGAGGIEPPVVCLRIDRLPPAEGTPYSPCKVGKNTQIRGFPWGLCGFCFWHIIRLQAPGETQLPPAIIHYIRGPSRPSNLPPADTGTAYLPKGWGSRFPPLPYRCISLDDTAVRLRLPVPCSSPHLPCSVSIPAVLAPSGTSPDCIGEPLFCTREVLVGANPRGHSASRRPFYPFAPLLGLILTALTGQR
jgi:hypothetical protein